MTDLSASEDDGFENSALGAVGGDYYCVVGVEELVVDAEAEFEGQGEEDGGGWFLLLKCAFHDFQS